MPDPAETGGSLVPPQEMRRSEAQMMLMRITKVLNMALTIHQALREKQAKINV
jgi:hypothetical protein